MAKDWPGQTDPPPLRHEGLPEKNRVEFVTVRAPSPEMNMVHNLFLDLVQSVTLS